MGSIALRSLSSLTFRDPRPFLVRLRKFEATLANAGLSPKLRALRTNKLKPWRELREAAIFCHLMGERIGTTVYVAPGESQDYDFAASWEVDGIRRYAPVQLKELVPAHTNSEASFEALLDGLKKYKSSPELVIAIHLNRVGRFDPQTITIDRLPVAEIWAFGAISPDQNQWALWGNLLETYEGSSHAYPAA